MHPDIGAASGKPKMTDSRYIAYYRVSTARQGASGLGQEAQRQAVEAFTAGSGCAPEVLASEGGAERWVSCLA